MPIRMIFGNHTDCLPAGRREDSRANGTAVSWQWRAAANQDDETEFRPTGLMERVSRYLERQTEPASRNKIESNVTGKTDYVRLATDLLVSEGYAAEGEGTFRPLRSVRPFRGGVEDPEDQNSPQFAPDSPQIRPGRIPRDSPPRPLPERGARGELAPSGVATDQSARAESEVALLPGAAKAVRHAHENGLSAEQIAAESKLPLAVVAELLAEGDDRDAATEEATADGR